MFLFQLVLHWLEVTQLDLPGAGDSNVLQTEIAVRNIQCEHVCVCLQETMKIIHETHRVAAHLDKHVRVPAVEILHGLVVIG